jgi:hypothetical protein
MVIIDLNKVLIKITGIGVSNKNSAAEQQTRRATVRTIKSLMAKN